MIPLQLYLNREGCQWICLEGTTGKISTGGLLFLLLLFFSLNVIFYLLSTFVEECRWGGRYHLFWPK